MTIRIFRNARIHTGDPSRPTVQALAVDGETIVAAGSEAEVRAAAGAGAELVDLAGEAVLPGLYDAHIHTANYARALSEVDLRDAGSLEEALAKIAAHAVRLAPGAWLFGGRWNSNTWDRPVQPDRHALDSVCPDRPVALPSVDGHTVWANSQALRMVGVDRTTPDPVGGQIVRDEHGEPTGILRESASYSLRALMTAGDLSTELHAAQEELLALGLTSVHDIDGEDCRAAYLELYGAGRLKLRVHKAIPVAHLEAAIEEGRHTGQGDDWFRTGPVKLFSDGALGSHTCHMSEAFAGDPGNLGIAVTPYDDLEKLIRTAAAARIAVATHAIGDQANHLVVNAYEAVGSSPGLRHRIEHAQHLRRTDITRMARLGIVASMQPVHCTSDIDLVSSLLAGQDLASYAWRTMLNEGVPLAFGSDAPVEHPNPFAALHAAVTRTRPDGTPAGGWQPEQRLNIGEALLAHTLGSAYAAGEEGRKGLLAPGLLADLIAVDTDPFTAKPDSVQHTKVLTTVVGGDIRWQRS
ncbi:amidohydrolase [Streptosporangium lutulentum]|uniref:Amidohydrolase YtcJ n=1 Tax=Streptosporangium lutulentum TaxID=1461250 RepID=A0ABT9Q7H2_9ACTN|nr:amidohydrolase [Streptosporangium lutulentum]MDP9842702.1 putative amidohydrolase YtcJ [Streptosporangium lutulentum]